MYTPDSNDKWHGFKRQIARFQATNGTVLNDGLDKLSLEPYIILGVIDVPKRNQEQEEQTRIERDMTIFKRDDMIQKARFDLTIQEQRCVLYAISKIKPTDPPDTVYTFDISDFYALCGLQTDSYTKLKRIVKDLSDKSWWIPVENGKGETLIRWFSSDDGVIINRSTVSLKFSKPMAPYVTALAAQGKFFTGYGLLYVLPMKRQYSPRLYELLKSYEKNNQEWFFTLDNLKRLLDCESYERFYDFKRRVLDPAVEEVNKYTDLNIAYTVQYKKRIPYRIVFSMMAKDYDVLTQTRLDVTEALDGQIDIDAFLEAYRKEEEEEAQRRFEEANKDF